MKAERSFVSGPEQERHIVTTEFNRKKKKKTLDRGKHNTGGHTRKREIQTG